MLFVVLLLWPWFAERNPSRKIPGSRSEMTARSRQSFEPSDLAQPPKKLQASSKSKGRGSSLHKGLSRLAKTQPHEPSRAGESREKESNLKSREKEGPEEVTTAGQAANEGSVRMPASYPGSTGPAENWRPSVIQTANLDIPEPANQMVIKWVTEDPNIVIVWLIDQKRGKENAQD